MESFNKLSTADNDHGRFRAHGLVEVTIKENLAHSEAWGPFNDEFVQAYTMVKKQVVKEMHGKGRWGHIVTFHRSALASQPTLDFYANYLKNSAAQSYAPFATAFVVSASVEGATLMPPLFAKCYQNAGLQFKAFTNKDDAEVWLTAALKLS
ncbi:MAG: hypothetical protein K2Y28_09175 [Burkholderiaceae bacterium]|nr:hypothetical protein [Burkholderiaceae bacterium]